MEIWEEIAFDCERGAKRLVAEFGTRLLTAASQITQNSADAEDLVFRTFTQVISKIGQYDGRSAFFGPSAIAVKRSDADLDFPRRKVHDLELEILEVA